MVLVAAHALVGQEAAALARDAAKRSYQWSLTTVVSAATETQMAFCASS